MTKSVVEARRSVENFRQLLVKLGNWKRFIGAVIALRAFDAGIQKFRIDDVTLLYPSTQGVSALKRYDAPAVLERYKSAVVALLPG